LTGELTAREVGVGTDTLEHWRSEALSKAARERPWTAAARFDAVLTTALSGPPPRRKDPISRVDLASLLLRIEAWRGTKKKRRKTRMIKLLAASRRPTLR